MMILFRTKGFQEAREIQVMPKFHIWDQTSGINPMTSIQMMKSSNLIESRSDRGPAKFKQNKTDTQQKPKTLHKDTQGTGASSSGLTPEERARSLLLPTPDETEGVPRGRSESQVQGDEGQCDTSSVPSTIEYPENSSADLVILNDSSWCFSE